MGPPSLWTTPISTSAAQIVGIRFPGFLPPGAVIKKAYVGFRARGSNDSATSLQIVGQLSHDAATFSATNNDISGRPATATSIPWSPGAWTGGSYQQTPDLTALIQELVNQPNWSTKSAIVLRIQGTGQRAASSFDDSSFSPTLQVEYDPTMHTELPVCATPEIVALNVGGRIPHDVAQADCQGRVATTLTSIAAACGYAQDCSCDLVNAPKADATFDRDVCEMPCVPNAVDSTCADFDPIGFERCVMQNGDDTTCKSYVSATHAGDAEPVCVATGTGSPQDSPYTTAYLAFGHRSTCEVEGTSHIEVGDREPTHDPETVGTVQILGDPCPGGGCRVAASFALAMDPVTFSVRWASDPTFSDLSASADSKATTMLAGVDAVFGPDGVGGTGNGRRGSKGLAVNASNAEPLTVGIDWSGKACDLTGNLATAVDGENSRRHLRRRRRDGVHGRLARLRRRRRAVRVRGAGHRGDDGRRRRLGHAREPAPVGSGGSRSDRRVHLDVGCVVHAERQRKRSRRRHRGRQLAAGSGRRGGGSGPGQPRNPSASGSRRTSCCA